MKRSSSFTKDTDSALLEEREDAKLRHQMAAQKLEPLPPRAEGTPRKRNYEETLLQPAQVPTKIHKLRLEAIFHPKFENESQTDKEIRQRMLQAIADGQGYLEVSLKHSGSLLLWSGGLRFYSKNSTDNVFTHVGEILLKQHFVRAFWQARDDEKNLLQPFDECSDYVQKHRLTLAFEAVTAVTGDHGDRPRRDFLILTAVADRQTERFWGTDEIVAFAQRFRLPHNDAWIFKSNESVQELFAFYDSARETGYAQNVMAALSKAADTRVESMLPHIDFQGNILEGIVIRFVPCTTDSTLLETMQKLAAQSRHISSQVPPSRPDAWKLLALAFHAQENVRVDSLLTTNLRDLYEKTKFGKREGPTSFAAAVAKIMDSSQVRRKVERVPKAVANIDWPSLTRDLRHSDDLESRRIAKVVELLDDISVRVDYSLMREHTPGHSDRWLCIVHVLHDFSFQKYRKKMQPVDMPLFRGFSFEINGSENSHPNGVSSLIKMASPQQENLMLKMKFLPYMVRTFGCRNGLSSLRQGGVEAFVKYTNNLLSKWGISAEGRLKWAPFFQAWAEYAHPRLEKVMPEEQQLRVLTGDNYLEHLERFEALYYTGKLKTSKMQAGGKPMSKNEGLVVCVAPKRQAAKAVADLVATQLDNANRIDDLTSVNKETMEMLCMPGQGAVCSAQLNDGVSSLRKLVGNFGKFISIILIGCSERELQSDLDIVSDFKMYRGLSMAWRKTRAVLVLELDSSTVLVPANDSKTITAQASEHFLSELEKIKLVFQVEGTSSSPRPGMLVFFPSMPGAGKSSVAGEETEKQLRDDLAEYGKNHSLVVRMGDKTKGKYWSVVKQERKKNVSSLYIADKNVPSPTWGLVASLCNETKAMAVPIFPDDASLKTTIVNGIRKPDGSMDHERKHVYPFSLHYLAVCMHRVVSRPPNTHPGKLDSSTDRACMIVLLFFGLYRRSTAEEFRQNLQHQFQQSGAVLGSPIEVPFFSKRTPDDLPHDLKDVLTEALQAYYGYDLSKKDPTKVNDTYIADLESRLRQVLMSHTEYIEGLTVDISESRKYFKSQFMERVTELDSIESWHDAETGNRSAFIKLSSIDVDVNDVHALLASLLEESGELDSLAKQMAGDSDSLQYLTGQTCQDRRFITNTHVTLAHCKESTQAEMRNMIGSIIGEKIEMQVVALLWDEKVAAMEVELSEHTTVGSVLPHPKRSFTHITVWCQEGASAFMSNGLPEKVRQGGAHRVVLEKPASLLGELAFWQN